MLKAYKYRIYPTQEQKERLQQFFGCSRFVYNLGLETKIVAYTSNKKSVNCFELIKQLAELKSAGNADWLNECPSQSLQMSLRNLDNAYTNFFKGGGFPKFKNKHSNQSIQFPQSVKVDFDNNKISFPKLKWIDVIFDRTFDGDIKTTTISKTPTNEYYVSILVDNHIDLPKKKSIKDSTSVGIDMGIKTFATLSDGTSFENLKLFRKYRNRLRVEQRTMNRRFKKGSKEQSKRYLKQKLVVAKLHQKIRNTREDYLHKVSISIIKKYDTIILEDLNIKGMMKNHKLALAVGEVGWNSFESKLKYKCEWYGKNLIYIGRFEPSSKICSSCGTINKELTLSDREWKCKKCEVVHDRDLNAAINIKNFGLRNKPSIANVEH